MNRRHLLVLPLTALALAAWASPAFGQDPGPDPADVPIRDAGPLPGGTIAELSDDFDQDGYADVVGTREGAVVFLRSRGDGTFDEPMELAQGTLFFEAADADGDGDDDFAIGSSLVINEGGGAFSDPIPVDTGGRGPSAFGDFDGDGIADLLLRQGNVPLLYLRSGLGDGTFAEESEQLDFDIPPNHTGAPNAFWDAAIADFDADGTADVVVSTRHGWSGAPIYIAYGTGDGGVETPVALQEGGEGLTDAEHIRAADLDGNGTDDLVMGSTQTIIGTTGALVVRFAPDRTFTGTAYRAGHEGWRPGQPADLDGDSSPDLLAASFPHRPFSVLYNDGSGVFSGPFRPQDDPPAGKPRGTPAAGDFDGDGDLDVAMGTRIYLNTTIDDPGPGPEDPGDGGGDGDVAGAASPSLTVHRRISPARIGKLARTGSAALVSCDTACRVTGVLEVRAGRGPAIALGRTSLDLRAGERAWLKVRPKGKRLRAIARKLSGTRKWATYRLALSAAPLD